MINTRNYEDTYYVLYQELAFLVFKRSLMLVLANLIRTEI